MFIKYIIVLFYYIKRLYNFIMSYLKDKKKKFVYPVRLVNLSRVNDNIENYYIKKKITNIYNACYINSSIQCLFYLSDFINNIINYKGGKLTNASINLINEMTNEKNEQKFFSVSKIKKAMGEKIEIYQENNQEDTNEFISNYLDLLHKEVSKNNSSREIVISTKNKKDEENFNKYLNKFSRKNGNSFILDLFYGILNIKKYCKCKTFSTFSSFNILELPLDSSISNDETQILKLDDILITFISPNKISNAICEKCKEQIYSQTTFYFLPKYLIIYFGRKNDGHFIENKIEFPQKALNVNKFFNKEISNDSNDYIYNLKSIIDYRTIEEKGHYSAYCRDGNNWIYFDDHYITKYENLFLNGIPIVLFYEKENYF